jgi:uncharacterized protein YyaL (SSP411 family)
MEHESFENERTAALMNRDFVAIKLDRAFEGLEGSFDPEHAGFGGAPKFPMPANQVFLLRYWARTGKKDALDLAAQTLSAMAAGGVYDQLGGGFHRYSTDAAWRVPHFEKMLYDNAQLASNFVEAAQATHDPNFARVARETLDYVLRDMTDPKGGFYSAEDADSIPPGQSPEARKAEGAFYLWSQAELERLLGKDSELFSYRYGVEKGGNAPEDPHGEFKGKNILYQAHTIEETAKHFKLTNDGAKRSMRVRTGLDDKILTSWNGLMISALAKGSSALGEPRYLAAAEKAARFLRAELYDAAGRRLYHRWREGERAIPGMADDYSFLTQGLLDLYEASFDSGWLTWAEALSERQLGDFAAPEGGFYLTAEGHDANLIARVRDDSDNVEPSASSVSALNLLRLYQLTRKEEFRKAAEKTLTSFGGRLGERPLSLAQMLAALDFSLAKPRQIVLAGEPGMTGLPELLREVNARFLPQKVLILADKAGKRKLAKDLPFLEGMVPIKGRAAAYVCVDYHCELPTTEPAKLAEILDGVLKK